MVEIPNPFTFKIIIRINRQSVTILTALSLLHETTEFQPAVRNYPLPKHKGVLVTKGEATKLSSQ